MPTGSAGHRATTGAQDLSAGQGGVPGVGKKEGEGKGGKGTEKGSLCCKRDRIRLKEEVSGVVNEE